VLAIVIVLSAMWSVETLGSERSLKLWRIVLAGVLVVNFLSIPLITQSVHLHGEADPSLVGNWRGLYFHKNIAGSVSAITAIVFFFSMLKSRSIIDAILFAAAVLFTAKTHSKASLGLLPVAIAFGCSYYFTWRRGIDRIIIYVALGLTAVLAAAVVAMDSGVIARVFEDPTQFTGRAAIWQAELSYIRDHPLFGSGFGSFADTGAASPLHAYVADAWVQNVAHGHNAYLQLFVTIGGIGFVLALLAFVATPLAAFWRESNITMMPTLFAIFTFMVLHNFLESDFLEGDGPAWVAFLLMLAMLRASRSARETRQTVVP
jgi:O-antigen ligase